MLAWILVFSNLLVSPAHHVYLNKGSTVWLALPVPSCSRAANHLSPSLGPVGESWIFTGMTSLGVLMWPNTWVILLLLCQTFPCCQTHLSMVCDPASALLSPGFLQAHGVSQRWEGHLPSGRPTETLSMKGDVSRTLTGLPEFRWRNGFVFEKGFRDNSLDFDYLAMLELFLLWGRTLNFKLYIE